MDLNQAITLTGATVLVMVLTEMLKRLFAWGQAQVDRYGSAVAIVIGIVAVVLLTLAGGADTTPQMFAGAVITGILAGASASGIYDALPNGVKSIGTAPAAGD